MDVKIEAAPMAAEATVIAPTVIAQKVVTVPQVISLVKRVASSSCPSMGSHSISAVAPDTNFTGGLAKAA